MSNDPQKDSPVYVAGEREAVQGVIGQDASSDAAIRVRGLRKSFGRTAVLRKLDLDVLQGEFIAIYGPNGSGKTTFVKILATLARADAGDIYVAGYRLPSDAQKVRGAIGVVTHSPLLYDDLTAYENLKFYGQMFGLADIDQSVHEVVERLGLTDRLHQKVGTLSHGLRKRFSIARALLHNPSILLMDEPESGLDQAALERLEEVLRFPAGPRTTLLMTTHSVEWGLSMTDRVAILSRGQIAFSEPSADLDVNGFRRTYQEKTGDRL